MSANPSREYIRGLVEGSGNFTFTSNIRKRSDGSIKKTKIPTFTIGMHIENYDLLCKARDVMGLSNKIYTFAPYTKDGYNRGRKAILTVREIGNLKNLVVPFFYNKLIGDKSVQFEAWLSAIGKDPLVPEGFKIIYRLHRSGYYTNNTKSVRNVSRETS
ncbi:MAG: LAGLIDADG family homing endonuclease [Candidatus Colwellbacteria bacterium]